MNYQIRRYCTFSKRTSGKNDKFHEFMNSLTRKEWKMKEIDKNGNVYLGYQTIYYVIHFISLLLNDKIDFKVKAKDIPRINFIDIIKEMNQIISVVEQ